MEQETPGLSAFCIRILLTHEIPTLSPLCPSNVCCLCLMSTRAFVLSGVEQRKFDWRRRGREEEAGVWCGLCSLSGSLVYIWAPMLEDWTAFLTGVIGLKHGRLRTAWALPLRNLVQPGDPGAGSLIIKPTREGFLNDASKRLLRQMESGPGRRRMHCANCGWQTGL